VYSIYIMVDDMAKKIKAPDFTAYIWRDHKELDPGYLQQCRAFLDQMPRANPFEAASSKPQAASDKQVDKVK